MEKRGEEIELIALRTAFPAKKYLTSSPDQNKNQKDNNPQKSHNRRKKCEHEGYFDFSVEASSSINIT